LGRNNFGGYDGGSLVNASVSIKAGATQNWASGSARGTYLSISITPNNSITLTEAMRIDHTGNVGIGTTSPYAKLSVVGEVVGSYFTATSTTATTTLAGGLNVGSGGLVYDRSTGNVGVGTAAPGAKIDIYKSAPQPTDLMFQISTSTGVALKIQADGAVYSDNAYSSAGADYAEYFFTRDAGLKPGEAVCVDVENENAVKRCSRPADSNVMGIVSTKPAIIGNTKGSAGGSYAIVGLLGQVPAKASAANGEIRPGDSLTPAAEPGYIMRANAGDSTVGVALEALTSPQPSPSQGEGAATGMINILISRRNKSLSVEEVENKITDRIAAMEIEDEVNILIANAVDNLNLDDQIAGIVDGQLLAVNAKLTVEVDNLTNQINNIKNNMDSVLAGMSVVENNIIGLEGRLAALEALGLNADCYFAQLGHPMSNWTSDVQVVASST